MEADNEKTLQNDENNNPWYALNGDDGDVFFTSRVRIIRNLANFPFPLQFKADDRERVNAILLDVFSKVKNPDDYHVLPMEGLSSENYSVLQERGILKPMSEIKARHIPLPSTVVMNSKGDVSVLINQIDHLRLAAFKSGLDFTKPFSRVSELDAEFQNNVQFASSLEFGYLTSAMKDLGSGIKFSAWVNLQMTIRSGKLAELLEKLKTSPVELSPAFPELSRDNQVPAGCIFNIATCRSLKGSEVSQLADMEAVCSFIAEYERKISQEYADNHMTVIVNSVMRSLGIARNSLLLSLREAIDIIGDVHTGLRLGLVTGIDFGRLTGLLFRVQPAHLSYVMEEGNFDFEKDVRQEKILMIDRLRALAIQEAFENISLRKL